VVEVPPDILVPDGDEHPPLRPKTKFIFRDPIRYPSIKEKHSGINPSACCYWRPRLNDIRTQLALLVEQLSAEKLVDISSSKIQR
jgi:hypothetical protein